MKLNLLYVLLTIVVVLPGTILAVRTLAEAYRVRSEFRAATSMPWKGPSVRIFVGPVEMRLGAFRLSVAWRPWAAAVVLFGAVSLIVGLVCLLLFESE